MFSFFRNVKLLYGVSVIISNRDSAILNRTMKDAPSDELCRVLNSRVITFFRQSRLSSNEWYESCKGGILIRLSVLLSARSTYPTLLSFVQIWTAFFGNFMWCCFTARIRKIFVFGLPSRWGM